MTSPSRKTLIPCTIGAPALGFQEIEMFPICRPLDCRIRVRKPEYCACPLSLRWTSKS